MLELESVLHNTERAGMWGGVADKALEAAQEAEDRAQVMSSVDHYHD